MTSIKEDFIEIINQDLDYVRVKFSALRAALPEFLKHPVEASDDLIAKWSSNAVVRRGKRRKGRRSKNGQ